MSVAVCTALQCLRCSVTQILCWEQCSVEMSPPSGTLMGITSLTVMGRCFGKREVEINTSITSLSYIELLLGCRALSLSFFIDKTYSDTHKFWWRLQKIICLSRTDKQTCNRCQVWLMHLCCPELWNSEKNTLIFEPTRQYLVVPGLASQTEKPCDVQR